MISELVEGVPDNSEDKKYALLFEKTEEEIKQNYKYEDLIKAIDRVRASKNNDTAKEKLHLLDAFIK